MTDINLTDVLNLKGAALVDAAKQLDIKGRSKMTANQLRSAIIDKLEHNRAMANDGALTAVENAPLRPTPIEDEFEDVDLGESDTKKTVDPLDVFHVQPNRRDRRRNRRAKPARSAGESLVRARMAREAGERGKFYHNRVNRREAAQQAAELIAAP